MRCGCVLQAHLFQGGAATGGSSVAFESALKGHQTEMKGPYVVRGSAFANFEDSHEINRRWFHLP